MDKENPNRDHLPLTQSRYVLAKYGIQVVEPDADTLEETFLPSTVSDDTHYHPGPRAIG